MVPEIWVLKIFGGQTTSRIKNLEFQGQCQSSKPPLARLWSKMEWRLEGKRGNTQKKDHAFQRSGAHFFILKRSAKPDLISFEVRVTHPRFFILGAVVELWVLEEFGGCRNVGA